MIEGAKFRQETIENFLEMVAHDAPLPAAGSASALVGAVGAAMGLFLARVSRRREKDAGRRMHLEGLVGRLEELLRELLAMMDSDLKEYTRVLEAQAQEPGLEVGKGVQLVAHGQDNEQPDKGGHGVSPLPRERKKGR